MNKHTQNIYIVDEYIEHTN